MKNSNNSEDGENYSFETGPIRPPSEGGVHSLLLRPTRNCPWNRCTFCPVYKGEKFHIREVDEIKKDIETVRKIKNMIKNNSTELDKVPRKCYALVSAWIQSGERTVFLQDSNTLIMRTPQLVEILECLKENFSSLERITSYARSKTLARKSLKELKKIREAGLTRLHVGLESGDDEVLNFVNKGVTAEKHIEAGKKAIKAGFELSEYVMPDLGGKSLSEQHAQNTAKVLNQINPDYVRMRPLAVMKNTELYEKYKSGDFELSSPHERLQEIKLMIENLSISGKVCFDHRLNGWKNKNHNRLFDLDYEGYQFPQEKQLVLDLINEGLGVDESYHIDPRDKAISSL
ncbi:hypothetical protein AKJ49_00060 [candidate division MSBL1 archaeon SCGC-AAA382A03]|uniref:Radical SAM core domain-containing protein n=1 Tax=candidate division MSBL1 archaeon SCGC-AAA382A03 TaxID=1698278 RepID=A0A133VH61_9EURY|nr:hypothetical protein AKJ49_00060 [candidate division MSBL1 archaeon SCGC-AAA382A03]